MNNVQTKNEYTPDYLVTPGEILEDYLEYAKLTNVSFAEKTGLPLNVIDNILNAKAAITPEIAVIFEHTIGRPAHFWVNLERGYQEDKTRLGIKPRVDSIDFAKLIISKIRQFNSTEKSSVKITKTKIHKFIYICDSLLLSKDMNVIDENARAWNYGPVYPRVSNWLNKTPDAFSPDFKPDISRAAAAILDDVGAAAVIDAVLAKYGNMTAAELSMWSHSPGSPWEKAIERGGGAMNSPIDKDDMRDYFKGILDEAID